MIPTWADSILKVILSALTTAGYNYVIKRRRRKRRSDRVPPEPFID